MKKLIHSLMLVVLLLQSFLPAVDVFALEAGETLFAQAEMPAPQETVPPAGAEDQDLPTATATPATEITVTPIETPLASETLVETGTVVPTETPQPPIAESSLSPISIPTDGADLAVQEKLAGQPYQILLEADPVFATPGGKITISWDIPAIAEAASAELQLVFLFSPGMIPDLEEQREGVFDNEKLTYTLPAVAQGKFKLVIDEKAQAPFIIETLLVENKQVIGTSLLDFPERTALSREGGKIAAFNGNLKIRFPKDSVPADAEVLVGRVKDQNIPTGGMVGAPFEVTVYTLPTGKAPQSLQSREVKKFKEPLVFEIAYDESAIRGDERDLQLFYWNTEVGSWFTVPSSVDPEANILTGYSDHLTVYGVGINDFQIAKPPTLEGFHVSEFTGAAAYSYPLNLPAGPGGLQPQLSLNYNSQVVDQSTGSTQASWVGFGWSMDVLGIERNTGGTNFDQRDDTFSLILNGVGGMLLPSADGYYHTSDESFVRVQKNANDTWSVWDKVGNVYFFDKRAFYSAPGQASVTWRWSLTWMENIHGQRLTYDYFNQPGTEDYASTIQAVYPRSILYPDGRTRIWFDYSADNERKDYEASWKANNVLHQRYFLKSVSVQRDTNPVTADGNFETTIRKYELAYETDPTKLVLPNIFWTNGETPKGQNLTLKSITEYGLGAAQALPATTFTYGDNMHLTEANNGYGGKVKFTYESYLNDENGPWHAPVASKLRTVEHIYGAGESGNYCKTNGSSATINGGWETGTVGGMIPWCSHGYLYVNSSKGQNPAFISPLESRSMLKPGAYYRLVASISAADSRTGTYARLGIGNSAGPWKYGSSKTIVTTPSTGFDDIIYFEPGATYGYVLIDTDGAKLSNFTLQLLPTFYRVLKKEIYVAGQSAAQGELSYSYVGASMNTAAISAVANTTQPLSEPGSEFRGHSQVTVTSTDGTKTVTTYCQSDECKGKPLKVTTSTSDSSGILLRETIYEYESVPTAALPSGFELRAHVVPTVGAESWPLVTGLSIDWNRTNSITSKIYASDGSYSATREVYTYEPTYGNQTVVTSQFWNGSDWVNYVRTETEYYPNTNGVYLVGLPGKVKPYDTKGTPETNDDVPLAITLYQYDDNQGWYSQPPSQGKLTAVRTKVSEPDQYTQVSYTYDEWGNRVSETTWSGHGTGGSSPITGGRTTTTLYDATYHTYPVSVKNPLNQIISWTYNYGLGVPVSETDPNGAVTTATYDDFGRLVKLVRPGDDSTYPTLLVSYSNGAPFETTIRQRLDGNRYFAIRRVYDGMGRQVRQQSGSGRASGALTVFNTVDTQYVSANQTKQSAPYASGETPAYTTTLQNPTARSTTVTAPDGSQTVTVVNGLTTTVTDPAGRVTTSQADVWGRTISVTPPDGPGLTYTYDLLGRLLTATRGEATTKIKYDMAGRKIGMDDPDMGIAGTLDDDNWGWTYTYDALGNLTGQTDARGCSLTLSYDLLNRLTAKNSSGTGCGMQVNTTYTYDAGANGKGRRTAMQDASTGSGSTTWAYDGRGRMVLENKLINGQVYRTQWTYNSADLPVNMTYPDGEVVTNYYTPQMLLDYVDGDSTYVYKTDYDAAGRIVERKLGGELIPVNPPAPAAPIFSDVAPEHWARDIIEGLYTLGIVGHCATSPLRFCPENQDVTRASIAVDILRAKYGGSYIPPAPASQRFTDVPATHPAYAWIDKFAADGITTGCSTGMFCPDSQVLRIQVIIFLLRAKYGGGYVPPAVPEGGHIFADMIGNSAEAWAVDAYNKGITNGCGNGNFCPNDPVYRAMAAVLIEQAFKRIPSPLPEEIQAPVIEQTYNYYSWNQQGGRLQELVTTTSGYQTPVQSLLYQYDSVGNISAINNTVNNENQGFGYDPLDRLTSWTLNNTLQERYTYSPNGNLLSKGAPALSQFSTEPSGKYTLFYDPAHPHAANTMVDSVNGDVVNSYTYDANGNQTIRNIYGDGSYTLGYDAENRLVKVEKAGATLAQFTYDGDGRRVIGVENGQTTHYVGGHYEKVLSGAPQQFGVSVPISTFDTNTTWQSQQTSPGTWLWRTNWWGAHSGTTNQVITNNAYGNLTSKPIPVTPSTQYALSAWVRGELNDQVGEAGWIIRASYYTSTDQYISYTDVAYGIGSSLSTTWAQKSGTVTTPANAAFVRVFLYNHLSSGWVAFDDISFKKNGTSTELLEDPGFELGTGWTTTQTSPATWLWRATWMGNRSGSYGYVITNNVFGHLTSKPISVTPNTQYTLSAWLRGELDDSQGEGGWIIRAFYYTSTDQSISYTDVASGTGSSISTTWAQKSGTVTTPANAAFVRVVLFNHLATGWVTFDDISFKKNGTSTELVEDPGFELGTGWTANQTSPVTWLWRLGWGGEAAPRSGSFSYVITNMVYGDLLSKLIPVTSGALYDISTWIRGEVKGYQGEGGFILRVEAYDTNGQYINYADLAASYQGVAITPTWQQLQRQYTAPAGAAYIRVRMFNHRASGWAAFDDLSVKKTGTTTELLQNPGFEAANNTPLNSTSISNGYAVTAGAAYSITANIRGEKTDPSATWQMRANFYDNSGQLLESKEVASQATQTIGLAAPGTVASNLIAPAGAAALKIELKANFTTGWINFSDILVTKADGVVAKYYFAGAQRIAMRKGGELSFLLSDHLGSTSITTDAAGTKTSELRYSPWGEVRFSSSANPGLPTDYTFTGQYSYMDDPTTNGVSEGFGLMFYNARWYDPALGRFAQADTIIPLQTQGTQAWDRYAYVNNNPVMYTDPSGHMFAERCGPGGQDCSRTGDRSKWKRDKTYIPLPKPPKNKDATSIKASGIPSLIPNQTLFSYNFYIPPYQLPGIEEDGNMQPGTSNWFERMVNLVDLGVGVFDFVTRTSAPEVSHQPNVYVTASYTMTEAGMDSIVVTINNQSDAVLDLNQISAALPSATLPDNLIRSTDSASILQVQPTNVGNYLLCSNCVSDMPSSNVRFLPTQNRVSISVAISWFGPLGYVPLVVGN